VPKAVVSRRPVVSRPHGELLARAVRDSTARIGGDGPIGAGAGRLTQRLPTVRHRLADYDCTAAGFRGIVACRGARRLADSGARE
jgi:hypothetical protein